MAPSIVVIASYLLLGVAAFWSDMGGFSQHLFARGIEMDYAQTVWNHHTQLIAVARLTLFGWYARWDTASVPSGTYALQSVAHDGGGRTSYSKAITIAVHNP